ncbi:hypothetical protein GQ55_7G072700 [Panicum hallii var. hallii]|uniref:Uncharacterized protein n=2 Tax=Panicum hallii TaxID=206008 RepID=A0A2T7CSR9_9POAL|nr:hypothetical protein PAHAL_7G071400 [Panicum hallii]PUZ46397.1 hypothetical protein GQ55_7G072700 [Panicum hallii var. hallii]
MEVIALSRSAAAPKPYSRSKTVAASNRHFLDIYNIRSSLPPIEKYLGEGACVTVGGPRCSVMPVVSTTNVSLLNHGCFLFWTLPEMIDFVN